MFTLGYDSIDEFLLRVHIQLAIDGAYVGFHRIGRHGEFFADGTPRLPLSKQQHHLGLSLRHRTLGSHEPHDPCEIASFKTAFARQHRAPTVLQIATA